MGNSTFPAQTTGAIPFGATAARPASPSTGQPFFNGTVGVLEVASTTGSWVSIASQSVPAPTSAPTVAVNTTGYAAATSTAAVSWSAVSPAGNIAIIDSYTLTVATTTGTTVTTVTTSALSTTVTGLTSGTTYNFTYVAKSGSNASSPSPTATFKAPQAYVFTSSQTWSVPATGTYIAYAIGGGGGSGGASNLANGGGSGYLTTASVSLTASDSIVITLGSGGATTGTAGSATTIVRGGTTLASGAGGGAGQGSSTGAGGSGGGGGGDATGGTYAGPGGYWGSNGTRNNTGGGSLPGAGQLGVAYGAGTNQFIPSGGAGSYAGNNGTAWAGLFGSGGGLSAATNEAGIQRGGGAGGATWAQTGRAGNTGIAAMLG